MSFSTRRRSVECRAASTTNEGRANAKTIQICRGFQPFGACQSYLKVALARPNWIRSNCSLEWFCVCAGLLLWCWPPCFGKIDDESTKTFCEHNPRTQKLIILKPRGQKLQNQHDDFQTIVGLTLMFLATRLSYNYVLRWGV